MIGYEKYKLTHSLGFEKIPAEWDLKKVKYLFHIGRGRVISQEELMDNGLYPVFSSQTQNNGCLGYINTFDFDCDQLTWTTDGANAGTVFIRSGKHNCTNVCGTLQPITDQTNLKFSHYALQYATQFHKRPDTNGAKIMNNEMAEISFALPAECEQFKIIEYLDHETAKIDNLIAKQEKLIELLNEKRQAVISHAVTKGLNPNVPMKDSDVEWLGQVPEHWDVWKFAHIAPIITCGVASTPTYVEEHEGIPFLSAQNIKNNKLSLHKFNYISHSLHEQLTRYRKPELGDILVTRVGAGIGEACIVDIDLEFSIYVSLTHIRVNQNIASNKFIMYFFGTDYCKFLNHEGTVTGGGVGNLNVNNVVKYQIGLPSLEEQQKIVGHIENYIYQQDELISKAESAIQLMQERRTALISAAVTGKIDVRNWQNPNKNNEKNMELSV